jgi:hypothetical protein
MSRTPLEIVSEVEIATPCSARWEEMTGNKYVRFCSACKKNVYDISDLTAKAALALIQQREQGLCLRLFRRADGTVLTADCPGGSRPRGWAPWVWVTAAVAVVIGWVGLLVGARSLGFRDPFWFVGVGRDGGKNECREVMGDIGPRNFQPPGNRDPDIEPDQ